MCHSKSSLSVLAAVSLDAEIASEEVEWYYLFNVLEQLNLGDIFIAWMKLVLKSQGANID